MFHMKQYEIKSFVMRGLKLRGLNKKKIKPIKKGIAINMIANKYLTMDYLQSVAHLGLSERVKLMNQIEPGCK